MQKQAQHLEQFCVQRKNGLHAMTSGVHGGCGLGMASRRAWVAGGRQDKAGQGMPCMPSGHASSCIVLHGAYSPTKNPAASRVILSRAPLH